MTYRNKLLLKRFLVILAIAAGILLVLLIIGFTYLGRFVIYTEDGAYFSFMTQAPEPSDARAAAVPSSIELITGEPIAANEVLGDKSIVLTDREIHGILVDYNALTQGDVMEKVDLNSEVNNTLVMEMRTTDKAMVSSMSAQRLLDRAKNLDMWTVAVLSCLTQTDYALEHQDMALRISGGALFVGRSGTYFLDPGNDDTIAYVVDLIGQLAAMGFDEVILSDFYMPTGSSLSYDFGSRSAEDIFQAAYDKILEATEETCKVGLLVLDPSEEQQGTDTVERLYVCFNEGATVRSYAEAHSGQYLVFITDSHDTRFDSYGKVEADSDFFLNTTGKTEIGASGVSDDEEDQDGDEDTDTDTDTDEE